MSILEKKLKVFYLKEAPSSRLATPKVEQKPSLLVKGDTSFLNNLSNQQKGLSEKNNLNEDWENAPTLVVSPGPNGISPVDLQGTGVQYPDGRVVKSNPENTPVGENGENVQRLNNVLNNNEVISQINAQNEALFKQNELLKQQVSQLQQQVSQLTQPQIQQQIAQQNNGQPANQEILQQSIKQAEQKTKKEGIKGLLQWAKEHPGKAAGAALLIAGGAAIALPGILALSASLTATTGVMGASGAIGTFGAIMPASIAGGGAATLGTAQLISAGYATVGTAMMASGLYMAGKGSREKIQPAQPTIDTPAPQLQEPVVKQQVQQPQFQENLDGNMEQAKNIVRGLGEIKGEKISFMYGESVVELYSKNGEYLYDTTNQGGTVTGETDEKTLTQTLSGYPENVLVSLQQQINDKKAEQSKPVEQLNSPENKEKPFDTIKLSELQPGKIIEVTGTNSEGKEVKLTVRRAENDKLYVTTEDGQIKLKDSKIYSTITTKEGNRETITKINDEISNDKNATVDFGGLLKLDVTDAKLVKAPVAEVPQPETPLSTPSSETAKSPEAISQSAYAEIGKNLDKISETADELNSDLLKNLHGGLYKKSEPFTFTEKDKEPKELNLNEYLSATAKPSLENLLGVEPSFGNPAEFTPQELIKMSLAIENTTEIKDSLKEIKTAIPDKIANYKGDSAAYEVMQVVGENLEIAKEIIRTNRIVEKIKAENTNAANGLNAILKASKDNPIIQTQIADNFAEIRTKVSLEEFSKQLDEALNTKPAPVDNIFVGENTPKEQKDKNQAIALKLGEKYYTPPNN